MNVCQRIASLLLLLVAVLAGGVVSASEGHGPETRVRANPTVTVDIVAASSSETAGGVRCVRPVSGDLASGSCVATNTARPGTALQPYYPANNGFHGTPKPTTLQPGATLDRYGSDFGRFTSPTGTPMHQRALPPGAEDGAYSAFRVVEPLTVQAGQVAPAFGSFGGGTQYLLPKSVKELLESGVIERVTP